MQRDVAVGSWEDGFEKGPPWHDRFMHYLGQYDRLSSPAEQAAAVAVGLRAWADLVPQQSKRVSGEHEPANSWGLAPEFHQVQALVAHMTLHGHVELALRLERMVNDLQNVAEALDDCYPVLTASDKVAERRLSRFARQHARSLAVFLERLRKFVAAPATGAARPRPATGSKARPAAPPAVSRRARRAADTERLKAELIEHIRGAADHARAAIAAGRQPQLLPRPSKADLACRLGLARWAVSRCFSDPAATELRVLWEVADDLDTMLKRT